VHVSEPIKDALGVAWCTGSGYVARRDALDEIGNFPLGSLAEDVATSTLLLGRGWKTAYIHESLQFGTVPDTYGGHIKQRTRWVSHKMLKYLRSTSNTAIGYRHGRHILQAEVLPMGLQDPPPHLHATPFLLRLRPALAIQHLPNPLPFCHARRPHQQQSYGRLCQRY
jgi:hypothetical protein